MTCSLSGWAGMGDSLQLTAMFLDTLGHFSGAIQSQDPFNYTTNIDSFKNNIGGTNTLDAISAYTNATFDGVYHPPTVSFYDSRRLRNVLSISTGHNDYIQGYSAAATYTNMLTLVGMAQATGFTVIINTVMFAVDFGSSAGVGWTWRADLNAAITGGAAGHGYLVMNQGGDATLGCNLCYQDAAIFPDGTHLSATGVTIQGNLMSAILSGLGFI